MKKSHELHAYYFWKSVNNFSHTHFIKEINEMTKRIGRYIGKHKIKNIISIEFKEKKAIYSGKLLTCRSGIVGILKIKKIKVSKEKVK